jgi:Cd2+-exporting ATPase
LTQDTTAIEGDDGEKSSETMSCSVGTERCSGSTEEEYNSGYTTKKSSCTGNSKADRSSPMEEFACTATRNDKDIIAGKTSDCCVVEKKDECRGSKHKDDSFNPRKRACSGENQESGCCSIVKEKKCSCHREDNCCGPKDKDNSFGSKREACSDKFPERACCSTTKEDNRSDHKRDRCCSSDRSSPSATMEDGYAGCEAPRLAAYSGKSCCTTADEGTTGPKAPGTFSYCSSSSGSHQHSKDARCIGFRSRRSMKFDKFNEQAADQPDIKKGAISLEHIILDVRGLTCVGCETKLFRSLSGIPRVRNLRASLMLSQAEFDLDKQAGLVVEVIKSVEKTTGFTCKRLKNEGQEIDVIVNSDAKYFVERKYPDGITRIVASGRQTVRITYDAKVIGARALLEKCFDSPLKLAAPRGSSELESGKKHVRNTA